MVGSYENQFDTVITCRSISSTKPMRKRTFKGFFAYFIDEISKSIYISTYSDGKFDTYRFDPKSGTEISKFSNIARVYQTENKYFYGRRDAKYHKESQDVIGELETGKIVLSNVIEDNLIYIDKKIMKPKFLDDKKETRYWDYAKGIPQQVADILNYHKNLIIKRDNTTIRAYGSKNFDMIWTYTLSGDNIYFPQPIRIVNDRIFLYSLHENIYCSMLDLKGNLLNKFDNVVDIHNDLVIQIVSYTRSYFATNYITMQKMKPFTPEGMSDEIYCSADMIFINHFSGLHVYDAKTLKLIFISKIIGEGFLQNEPIITDKWIILGLNKGNPPH